jgi:hypothetical protein
VLDVGQSAALRDKLLAEVANLASAEVAITWAGRALGAKNSLTSGDAKLLEDAFEQKLAGFPSPIVNDISAGEGATTAEATSQQEPPASRIGSDEPRGIDKSVLAVAAPRRYRNRETCALSLDSRALYAAASHRIRIISGICSHAPWAVKRAMNSRSRSAACITGPRIALATNAPGGKPPASIP